MDIAKNARRILRLVADDEGRKRLAMVRAEADFAGAQAASAEWDRHNPDDGVGGMSGNPYRASEASVTAARTDYEAAREAMEFATVTFVSMIPSTARLPDPKEDPVVQALMELNGSFGPSTAPETP